MRRAPRTRVAIVAVGLALVATPVARSGGNIAAGWLAPHQFHTRYWDVRQQPIQWRLEPNPELGLDESFVLPELLAAIEAWNSLPDIATPQTEYIGVGSDFGDLENTIILADLDRILGMEGAIALASCTILALENDVTDFPSCRSGYTCPTNDRIGDGYGFLYTGTNTNSPVYRVPIGHYDPGVTLSCDMVFNTVGIVFSNDDSRGTYDLRGVATHEFGHWWGLSHTLVAEATMYKVASKNPGSGPGREMATLEPDDIASLAHVYMEPAFGAGLGTITGRVTIDGQPGDGVHVTALRAGDLLPVAGRFSLPYDTDPSDGVDGADMALHGGGFYRIDGLPPGDYYLYAEWLDGTDERIGQRLDAFYGYSQAVSNVATSYWPYHGELDLRPERFEFHNALESALGGDGITAGAAADNPDEARLVSVGAGQKIEEADIAINLDPDPQKPLAERQNPTGIARHDLGSLANLRAGTVLSEEGNGNDDFWVLRFPAAELPPPPYNIVEGIWSKFGRADKAFIGGMMLADPADPDVIQPFIVHDATRLMTGWDGGKVAPPLTLEMRDRFNVTVNEPRDVFFVIQQPEISPEAVYFSEGYFVMVDAPDPQVGASGRTLVTLDGFETFQTSETYDVIYRVRTETAPPVMITGAEPAAVMQGETGLRIRVSGAGFRDGAQVDLRSPDFGPALPSGVSVSGVEVLDPATIELTVEVDPGARIGLLDVEVSNPEVLVPNRSRLMQVVAFSDTDADGIGDLRDCAPDDPAVWSVPDPVGASLTLEQVETGATRLSWSVAANPGGGALSYVVVRGSHSALTGSNGTDFGSCLAQGLDVPFSEDAAIPAPGDAQLYLVTSANQCGPAGFGSDARDADLGDCG